MITVEAKLYSEPRKGITDNFRQFYKGKDGLTRVEMWETASSDDFGDSAKERISEDNGKTFGEWRDIYEESGFEIYGSHERSYPGDLRLFWNPVHKHYAGVGLCRIFREGHAEAYKKMWGGNRDYVSDHAYVGVVTEDGKRTDWLVKYEDGADFDPADPLNMDHFHRNEAFPNPYLEIDDNGDILFAMGVPVYKCCEIAGVDVNEHFPSAPYILRNLMFIRGVWNGERYDFIPSRPILISDLVSSRGVDEPTVAKLASGRILIVFRGSNYSTPAWNTRIEPGTPGFKWYTYSDDGGKTFVPPMPWHFDDGEVIYSSASYSQLIRDARNNRLYWVGNITGHKIDSNHPRWPLCIVEVDQTYGTAKKETYTVIDTRREGESDKVQLTNFAYVQDRVSGRLEIYLTKCCLHEGDSPFSGEPWVYYITLPE